MKILNFTTFDKNKASSTLFFVAILSLALGVSIHLATRQSNENTIVVSRDSTTVDLKALLPVNLYNSPIATTTLSYSIGEYVMPKTLPNNLIAIPNLVAHLAKGTKADTQLSAIVLYYSSSTETIAYTSKYRSSYTIAINTALFNKLSNLEKVRTITHELTHVMTLDSANVKFAPDCATVSTAAGCTVLGGTLDNFYRKSSSGSGENAYVNSYAASNLLEDIAETNAYYVTNFTLSKDSTLVRAKFEILSTVTDFVIMKSNVKNLGDLNSTKIKAVKKV